MADRMGDAPTTRVLEMMTRRLDLTADQQQKIGAILDETRASLKASAEQRRELLKQTRDRIDAVLTPEQKGKAARMKEAFFAGAGGYMKAHGPEIRDRFHAAGDEMRLRAALSTLNLTDEQRGKLKEIEKNVQEKRRALMEEVKPKVEAMREEAKTQVRDVLTTEQQAQLKQKLEEMPKGPGFRGDHGGRRHFDGPRDRMGRGPRGPRAEGRRERPAAPPARPEDAFLSDLFR